MGSSPTPSAMAKILGIDYGKKRIGVAISDQGGKFAFPHSIVDNDRDGIIVLKEIIEKDGVEKIVFGESLNSDGRENPIMEDTRAFAERLSLETGRPVFFEKEFMTSVEAHRFAFKEQEKKGRQEVDASAAALILQRYLDRQR